MGAIQALTYLLMGCLGSSSQRLGEGRVYFTDTFYCIDFEVLVVTCSKLVIDCVSGCQCLFEPCWRVLC